MFGVSSIQLRLRLALPWCDPRVLLRLESLGCGGARRCCAAKRVAFPDRRCPFTRHYCPPRCVSFPDFDQNLCRYGACWSACGPTSDRTRTVILAEWSSLSSEPRLTAFLAHALVSSSTCGRETVEHSATTKQSRRCVPPGARSDPACCTGFHGTSAYAPINRNQVPPGPALKSMRHASILCCKGPTAVRGCTFSTMR